MRRWKFAQFRSVNGRDSIIDWRKGLSPARRAVLDVFLDRLSKMREWPSGLCDPIKGHSGCWEIRWTAEKVEHRIFGYYSGPLSFVMLIVARIRAECTILQAHFKHWKIAEASLLGEKGLFRRMNLSQSAEMRNREYRHGLVNAQIEIDLPLQIRALRKQLIGTQPELATLTGMKQPRISAMEKPGKAHFTLETLRRLAEAFDVALIVRFAPFSELARWSEEFDPEAFFVPDFDNDIGFIERKGPISDSHEIYSEIKVAASSKTIEPVVFIDELCMRSVTLQAGCAGAYLLPTQPKAGALGGM
jgi:transcriptional regulator with XRE-family HTH domain